MRLIVRPEAEADIGDAYAWYEAQRPGLGQRYLVELPRCSEQVQSAPKRYQPVRAEARRALLRRFPYGVFFVSDERQVSVVTVLQMTRDPPLWQERVDRDL
jgi:plasmid stabilization system protein ParE